MGSLPDSKYIIKTDGYWFVEAHDVDPSKGYITVSTKGIVNGLSNQPNDGADFGPDTYNPDYTGSGIPYTQTSALREALTYAITAKISEIKLLGYSGNNTFTYGTNDAFDLTPLNNYELCITGMGNSISAYIQFSTAAGITLNNLGGMSIVFKGVGIENDAGQNAITINGVYGDNVATGVFLDHVVFGGLGSTPASVMTINSAMVNGTAVLTSDNSAPSLVLNNCWSSFDSIMNSGYIQAVGNGAGGLNSTIHIGFYQFLVKDQTTPQFKDMSYVDISNLWIQMEMIFEGTNNVVNIHSMTIVGNNGSAGSVAGFLAGTGTTPTIQTLYIGNAAATFSGSPSLINSNLTVSANYIGRSVNPNFTNQIPAVVNSVTTPTVPASGTAQQNTNPYPVNVYLYGGTVTVIDYTPSGGSATQVGTSGPATVRLNPGDSITLTYSAAPTWNWVAV